MSSKVEELLKYLADQGITLQNLISYTTEDIEGLVGTDGKPFGRLEILLIQTKISEYKASLQKEASEAAVKPKNRELDKLEREEEAPLKPQVNITDAKTSTTICNMNNINVEPQRPVPALSKHRVEEYFSMTRDLIQNSAENVLKMVNQLKSLGSNLDLCFTMDATGSMAGLINGVKNCIINVSQKITSNTGMTARFALVVYRDYCDGPKRHEVWDFGDSAALSNHLASVSASGGGDAPEDCFGGLYAACNRINWKAPSRIIIWMGDSPQHGLKYSGGDDSYPNGDPDGVTSEKIFSELQNKKIVLVFCKLTSATDRMMSQLRQEVVEYGENLLLEYNFEGDNIGEFITKTITSASARTSTFLTGALKGGKEKPHTITPATWSINPSLWREEENSEIIKFQAYTGSDLHPLIDLLLDGPDAKKRTARINVTINPVAKGEMRLAYYSKVSESREFYYFRRETKKGIIKESRFEGEINSRRVLVNQAKIQAVACYMADIFNRKMAEFGIKDKKFIYVPVELIYIPTRTEGTQYFLLEPYIEGEYLKFNNNNGYVNKIEEVKYPILQTFSHFSYSFSKGLVMVTDLQGVVLKDSFKLTDPAIHTADNKKQLPDPTNLGPNGMAAFFKSHECNHFCRIMELKTPETLDTAAPFEKPIDPELSSIEEEDEWDAFD